MRRKSLVVISAITLILVGCSYIDGVYRYLSFDRELGQNDFVCLTDALISQGYKAEYSTINRSVYYELKHPDRNYDASFRQLSRDNEGKLIEASKELLHRAVYGGSEPNECADVKPAASMLVSIEDQVFLICNLALVKKPKQKISRWSAQPLRKPSLEVGITPKISMRQVTKYGLRATAKLQRHPLHQANHFTASSFTTVEIKPATHRNYPIPIAAEIISLPRQISEN